MILIELTDQASEIMAIICGVIIIALIIALAVLGIIADYEKEQNKKDFKQKASDEELLIISKYEAHKREKNKK